MEWIQNNKWSLLKLGLCLFLFFFIYFEVNKDVVKTLGQDQLIKMNTEYLANLELESRDAFIKLSEVSAFLEIVKSSEVGISFIVDIQVQIGHILTTVTRLTEQSALISALISIASITLIQAFKFSEFMTRHLALTCLFSVFMVIFLKEILKKEGKLYRSFHKFSEFFVTLFLILHLAFPYSVHFTSMMSDYLSKDILGEHSKVVDNLHSEVTKNKKKLSLKDRAVNAVHSFEKTVLSVEEQIEMMAKYYITHFALALLQVFILPIILLAFMCIVIRSWYKSMFSLHFISS